MKPEISVIIPTLNEARIIKDTLIYLKTLHGIKEVIVVDGGSTDSTYSIATQFATEVLQATKGRALQMNLGASHGSGKILLFLHADCCISQQGIDEIYEALKLPQVVGGGFKLAFDDPEIIFKAIALGSNLRARLHGIYFGDQGIFVLKEVFERVQGYPEVSIFEEWELCKKIKQYGKLQQLKSSITTSSRRWHKYGILRTIYLMHKLKIFYLLGIQPQKLSRIYSYDKK